MTNLDPESFENRKTRLMGLCGKSAAAAVILQTQDGRYVLQKRDPNPAIWFPDVWGCFGGAVDDGETLRQAAIREIKEELSLEIPSKDLRYFTEITFDFSEVGSDNKYRIYFEYRMAEGQEKFLTLSEGQAIGYFDEVTIVDRPDFTPYDKFALHLHAIRSTIVPPGQNCRD